VCRTKDDISLRSTAECMGWFIPEASLYSNELTYGIHIVYTEKIDTGEKMLEIIEANVGADKQYLSYYNRRDDLRVFFARKINALFYTDIDGMNTIIFTDRLEMKHFHTLQILIPKYLPILFENSSLTEIETSLLKSTGNKSAVEYEMFINELSKGLDIRSDIIRIKLAGFESAYERRQVSEIRRKIFGFQQDYDNYLQALRDIAQKKQTMQYALAGLEGDIIARKDDSELVEYFLCNKNLSIVSVINTTLKFIAHGYADIYDEEAFNQYVGNHNGYMYSNLSLAITTSQMEKLYRAIFEEGKYKLRICAAFSADMRDGLSPISQYTYPSESSTYLPNPHIQQYGCIGTYAGRFEEYVERKDYVGAIEQAIVSARNLNFYDSSAIAEFARLFSHTSIKCVEKSDGRLLTPSEAVVDLEGV